MQVGKMVRFRAALTAGSTTTYGTGTYLLSIPVASAVGQSQLCLARAYDVSANLIYRGEGSIDSGTSTVTRTMFGDAVSTTLGWTSAVPMTMATGDVVIFSGAYEAA